MGDGELQNTAHRRLHSRASQALSRAGSERHPSRFLCAGLQTLLLPTAVHRTLCEASYRQGDVAGDRTGRQTAG